MHLNNDTLDRLRAGYFDDANAAEQARAHLAGCAACRAALARWDAVASPLIQQRTDVPAPVSRELARRRGAALSGDGRGARSRGRWSYALAGAAAAVAVVVGAQVGTRLMAPAEPVSMADARAPEFFTDIEFYVWLANSAQDSGQGG